MLAKIKDFLYTPKHSYENRYPSNLQQRSVCNLRVRQFPNHGIHKENYFRGSMLCVPSVLYRQTEAGRRSRPRGQVPQAPRRDGSTQAEASRKAKIQEITFRKKDCIRQRNSHFKIGPRPFLGNYGISITRRTHSAYRLS